VCVYTREDLTDAVGAFTDGRGVDVVYHAIGKETFGGALTGLRLRGMSVSYRNSSGPVALSVPLVLLQKASFLRRGT
jgi:NADPH2:quinone reductase